LLAHQRGKPGQQALFGAPNVSIRTFRSVRRRGRLLFASGLILCRSWENLREDSVRGQGKPLCSMG
jgi:hypothetical protein